jgi:hypothetical protein
MNSEQTIKDFSEELYKNMIDSFNQPDSPFWLLTRDDATFSDLPGVTSANIRNVLIGGHSSGSATYQELIIARAYYEASSKKISLSLSGDHTFDESQIMDFDLALDHLIESSTIILTRIWSTETISTYISRTKDGSRNLSKRAVRALFGCGRRQKVSLYKLNMPIH